MNDYLESRATGRGWELNLGDSCELLPKIPSDSIDMSIYSPPFSSLYVYSASLRDVGNCRSEEEFIEHYSFVVAEMLRVTKTGRLSCVHAADVTRTKAVHGDMSLYDLPGAIIAAHVAAGWLYFGRAMVWKNPQAQAVRTHSHALLFKTKNKDSTCSRPAIGDSLLIFKKPGASQVPVVPECTNDEWIAWAAPVWLDIRESDTLNGRIARDSSDERHVCPLQLPFIERCVRLYSNRGETVLSPFAGIGSEVYMAAKWGRRGIGIELKPSYWETSVRYLRLLDATPADHEPPRSVGEQSSVRGGAGGESQPSGARLPDMARGFSAQELYGFDVDDELLGASSAREA